MVDVVPTLVEAAVCALFFYLLRRVPRTAVLAIVALSYALRPAAREHPVSAGAGGAAGQRAAVFTTQKDATFREDVPVPGHSRGELLVKVRAAGLNPSNFKVNMARLPFFRHTRRRHVVGYDVEGVVVGVGEDCAERFAVGDAAYGFASGGSIAEYAALRCGMAGLSPKSLTPLQTAGLPVVALTSMVAWDRSKLSRGQRALVIGASGGCGNFGVTMGKARGAHITGICSTRNVALVESLGADAVVDYKDPGAMEALKTGGPQFDIIYDTVSSFAPEDPYYETAMRPLLKPGGQYVCINGSPMDWTRGMLEAFVFKPLFGMSIQRPDFDLFVLHPTAANLDRLTKLIDEGSVPATVIDKVFPLDAEAVDAAFRRMKSRRAVGKIVFDIWT